MVCPVLRSGRFGCGNHSALLMERTKSYFVADVHLGLGIGNPQEREDRFVQFLKSIRNPETKALYLLGDIWDFWFEYRDVIPREGARVVSELIQLLDEGVDVFFFEGNHDMWAFSFFESLGMKRLHQPYFTEIGGKTFCLGHGDGLGGAKWNYALMLKVFHSKVAQRLFSTLHPWLAYRFGLGWSNSNRRTHKPYEFKGESEPLYKFAASSERKADFYIFGHYHCSADATLPDGSRLFIVKDWMSGGAPHICFDSETSQPLSH